VDAAVASAHLKMRHAYGDISAREDFDARCHRCLRAVPGVMEMCIVEGDEVVRDFFFCSLVSALAFPPHAPLISSTFLRAEPPRLNKHAVSTTGHGEGRFDIGHTDTRQDA
jgi:hypothetical protein